MSSQDEFIETKAGILPTSWETAQIQKVSSLVTNGFVGTATPHYTDKEDGITYIQGYNVRENKIDLSGVTHVTRDFANNQKKSHLDTDDMLTVQSGHIGTTAVVPRELKGANCHAVIITRFDKTIVNSQYIAYYLNSSYGRHRLRALEVGSSVLHINTKDFKKFYIPLPPLLEQRKIAEVLSTWDEAIAKTEQLIDALQRRKKGLMQRLLTGEVRFAGFTDEWEQKKLEKIVLPKNGIRRGLFGGALKKSIFVDNGYKVYQQGNVIRDDWSFGDYFISEEKYRELNSFHVLPGDFLVSCSGTIGKIVQVPESIQPGVINQALLRIRINSKIIHPKFFYYQFISDEMQNTIIDNSQGGAMQNLVGMKVFRTVKFQLPSSAEQYKIAEVLQECDIEISIYEKRLAALQQQKKGLMQRLLTGQVRVKVE